jgi:ubiquinone/menaquinone biosynthesis C-methylase UbiE
VVPMTRKTDGDRELIQEQIAYYERRAPEYDETATPEGDPLGPQEDKLVAALEAFKPRGRILELAGGTGTWTRRLLDFSGDITVVDASSRMLDLNREKVNDPRIKYAVADVFEWEPDLQYDVVFFANWLSHVPPSRFEQFWNLVDKALDPEGRVFFIDEAEDAWRHEETLAEEFIRDQASPLVRRTLRDGSAFRVIKVFWNPFDLQTRLHEMGWNIAMGRTRALYWGEGGRNNPSGPIGASPAQSK